jgi:MFS family permease
MQPSAAQQSALVPDNPPRAAFFAVVAIITAAGAEQGVTQGTLARMLQGLGVREAAGGLLLMMFALGIILASFGTAVIIRRSGDRKVMVLGAAFAAIGGTGHAVCRGYGIGLPLFFLAGIGHGAMLAGASSAAAESVPDSISPEFDAEVTHRRGRRISLVQAFYMMGLSAGALMGGYSGAANRILPGGIFDESGGWAIAFLASAAISVAAAIFMAVSMGGGRAAVDPETSVAAAAERFRLGVLVEVARLPGVALVVLILFLDICCEAGLGAWLSPHLQKTWSAAPPLAGWAVSLAYAGIAGGRLLFGCWSPRITLPRAVLVAAVVCTALTGLLAFVPPQPSLLVAALVGVAIALIVPYGLAIIRGRCPNALAGAATSAAIGVACLGSLVLPPTMGAVAQWTGSFKTAMLIPAALFAVMVALAAIYMSRERR